MYKFLHKYFSDARDFLVSLSPQGHSAPVNHSRALTLRRPSTGQLQISITDGNSWGRLLGVQVMA